MISKTYLVSGAAKGIGAAVSQKLLSQGHKVVMLDVDDVALSKLAKALAGAYSRQLVSCSFDLRNTGRTQYLIDEIEQEHGPIDGLICCAGILSLGRILDMGIDALAKMMSVNVIGTAALLQAVARHMVTRSQGNIVVIGSNAATTPRLGMAGYCSSKAALHSLVKNLGLELSQHGIRCNLVSPGSTRTEMQTQMWHDQYTEADTIQGDQQNYRLGIPLQKLAEPEEIADAALFLLSSKASHITMHDLRVDGGATL
ncbi:2,3-dihydro-2,3-dihydroxybenzoate dehydrogenase [Corallincola luteus]|nr:2,3-dihydro-2,3-dihydroxybenzoate dehydrogenase [Corallincola luteus]